MRFAEPAQPLPDDRCIGEEPAINGAVVDLEAALAEHFFQIAVAQRIAQIPGHRLNDQPGFEVASFEIVLRLVLQLLCYGIRNHGHAPLHGERNFSRVGQHAVNYKNLRQAPHGSTIWFSFTFA
ncbi:hypothetical protein D3C78_1379870 [compost metagenome]